MSVFQNLHEKFGVAGDAKGPLVNSFQVSVHGLTTQLSSDPTGLSQPAASGQELNLSENIM